MSTFSVLLARSPGHTFLCSQAMFGSESHIYLGPDICHHFYSSCPVWSQSRPHVGDVEVAPASGISPFSPVALRNRLVCPWVTSLIWGFSQKLALDPGTGKVNPFQLPPHVPGWTTCLGRGGVVSSKKKAHSVGFLPNLFF